MTGQLGVIYLLCFTQPYRHARHYTGKPESSRFLKAHPAADDREMAELSAAIGTSHCPVQLRPRDGELAAVRLSLGPASLIAPRIAEDPAREHYEALRRGLEVHIPAGLIEGVGEYLRQFAGASLIGFEVQRGPDVCLVGRAALGPVPADPADGQLEVLQGRSDAEALRYQRAFDHDGLLSRYRAAPRVQESRIQLAIAEECTGMPTRLQGSASGNPSRLPRHLTCNKVRPAPAKARTNCRQVQHWTEDLLDRLDAHAAGHGARLIEVITRAGIGFTLVRICEGTRRRERAIKNAGGAVRYCPACTPRPRNGRWGPLPADLTPRTYLAGRR